MFQSLHFAYIHISTFLILHPRRRMFNTLNSMQSDHFCLHFHNSFVAIAGFCVLYPSSYTGHILHISEKCQQSASDDFPVNRFKPTAAASFHSWYEVTQSHMQWFDARRRIFCQQLQPPCLNWGYTFSPQYTMLITILPCGNGLIQKTAVVVNCNTL